MYWDSDIPLNDLRPGLYTCIIEAGAAGSDYARLTIAKQMAVEAASQASMMPASSPASASSPARVEGVEGQTDSKKESTFLV